MIYSCVGIFNAPILTDTLVSVYLASDNYIYSKILLVYSKTALFVMKVAHVRMKKVKKKKDQGKWV